MSAWTGLQVAEPATLEDYRSIIILHCHRISDSCGYGVPVMAFTQHRTVLSEKYSAVHSDRCHPLTKLPILEDVNRLNAISIDGAPGPFAEVYRPFPTDVPAENGPSQRNNSALFVMAVVCFLLLQWRPQVANNTHQ
jgi:hypothetical protein